ncbi:MAG TPA: cysteine rich repeat-containing protein [Myxococcales bacterium]|nr:cysteine rich repeat-containing protein [Myxococcales bacterium]
MTFLFAILLAQAAQHPCVEDAKRLCSGVQPGQGRIAACLKEHKDQLSSGCKANIARFKEGAQACQADVEKLCPGTKPGPERHACMQQHKDEVSPGCKEFFSELMEQRGEMRDAMRACKGDAQKFCKDVKAGEGRIAACLKQHQGELSKGCAAHLGP